MRQPLHTILPEKPRQSVYRPLLLVLAGILALTLLAPLLAPYDPLRVTGAPYEPPTLAHLMGTDTLGRDVLTRTLWGGRQTLAVSLAATLFSILPGLLVGVLAGFYGGWLDHLLMAGMDVMLAFPGLLLALALISLLGTGQAQIAIAVGLAGLPVYARMTRTAVLNTRNMLYVEAAQAIGVPVHRVLSHHILLNAAPVLLNFAAVTLSWAVLNSAALTFLGFGGEPSTPEWGMMLNEGRRAFRTAPWIAIFPGLLLTLTLYIVNRLADIWQTQTVLRQ